MLDRYSPVRQRKLSCVCWYNSGMSKYKYDGIFKTERIETTHLYQNHVDMIIGILNKFCVDHPQYSWSLISPKSIKNTENSIEKYLTKYEPKNFEIIVKSNANSSPHELTLAIHNGIAVNVKNASFEMVGLFTLLVDTLTPIKVSKVITFLRRYWLFNLTGSFEFIPFFILASTGQWGYAIGWLILAFFIMFGIFALVVSLAEDYINNLEWNDVILSTKINYRQYDKHLGFPVLSILSSGRVIISILASLATIGSFIYLFAK